MRTIFVVGPEGSCSMCRGLKFLGSIVHCATLCLCNAQGWWRCRAPTRRLNALGHRGSW